MRANALISAVCIGDVIFGKFQTMLRAEEAVLTGRSQAKVVRRFRCGRGSEKFVECPSANVKRVFYEMDEPIRKFGKRVMVAFLSSNYCSMVRKLDAT